MLEHSYIIYWMQVEPAFGYEVPRWARRSNRAEACKVYDELIELGVSDSSIGIVPENNVITGRPHDR